MYKMFLVKMSSDFVASEFASVTIFATHRKNVGREVIRHLSFSFTFITSDLVEINKISYCLEPDVTPHWFLIGTFYQLR